MTLLIDICNLDLLSYILYWALIPLLLGLLLGWAIWGRWKRRAEEFETQLNASKEEGERLQRELEECRKSYHQVDGENAMLRGQLRELQRGESDTSAKVAATPIPTERTQETEVAGIITSTSTDSSDLAIKIGDSIQSNNLQIIEGIGPKMESYLKENEVNTWSAVANAGSPKLKSILDKAGGKYRIIDPSSWPDQARLASEGNWEGLISYQKGLDKKDGGESKMEKLLVRKGIIRKYKDNDLKVIEGIGPKIEELLHRGGITTWMQLSQASVEKIQGVLDQAGDNFRLADPGTWPKQAELAAAGRWKEFEDYIEFLDKGRAPE